MKSRSQESCAPADPARAHGSTEAKEKGMERDAYISRSLLGRGIRKEREKRNKDSRKESLRCVTL